MTPNAGSVPPRASRLLMTVLAGLLALWGVSLLFMAFAAMTRLPRSFPDGVDAVVVSPSAVAVPVGAPATYAMVRVATRHRNAGRTMSERHCATLFLGSRSLVVEVDGVRRDLSVDSPSQFREFSAESQNFDRPQATGLDLPGCQAPAKGVVVEQIALRPGDRVLLTAGSMPQIWAGGSAQLARQRDLAAAPKPVARALQLAIGALMCFGAVRIWRRRGTPNSAESGSRP